MGLMQLMPGTAAEMGASQPFDVTQNIFAGKLRSSRRPHRALWRGDIEPCVRRGYNAGPAQRGPFWRRAAFS